MWAKQAQEIHQIPPVQLEYNQSKIYQPVTPYYCNSRMYHWKWYKQLAKEIKDAIQKFPINKAPKLNKIPNEAIKAALEKLAILLANMATICL